MQIIAPNDRGPSTLAAVSGTRWVRLVGAEVTVMDREGVAVSTHNAERFCRDQYHATTLRPQSVGGRVL
ncbi:MAG: hypothetical protein Q8Q09_25255 [Deltaproteobacteria bacterium]|nr:hypothetical protein [Deltaproteobacteria bacterium]